MPVLEIQGKRVEVGEEFRNLTPRQQQDYVNRIAAQISAQSAVAPSAPPTVGELNAGNVLDSAAQGVSLGFSDELAGFAGNIANSLNRGLHNLTGWSPMDFTQGNAYEGVRDAARLNQASFAERNPGTALAAEMAGGLLTGGAGVAKTGVLQGGKGLLQAAGLGAAQGGAYGAGASEADTLAGVAEDAGQGAAFGGLLGAGLPAAGRFVGNRLKGRAPIVRPPDNYAQKVKLLQDGGVTDLTTARQLGQETTKMLETSLSRQPLVGERLGLRMERSWEQFQKELMKKAGVADDLAASGRVTDKVITETADAFSDKYAALLPKGKTVRIDDDQFVSDIAAIASQIGEDLSLEPKVQKRLMDRLGNFARGITDKGAITGKAYKISSSSLGRQAEAAKPFEAQLLWNMKSALDDAFKRQVPGGTTAIDKQFSRFAQIRDTYINNGGTAMSEGFLPIATMNRLSKRAGGKLDDTEWRDWIDAFATVFPEKTPLTGSGERAQALQSLKDFSKAKIGASVFQRSLADRLADGEMQGLLSVGAKLGPLGAAKRAAGQGLLGVSQRPVGLLVNPLALPYSDF